MALKNIVEICIGIDIAILGIAYPIIVDKISNIGAKYSSNYLSEIFNKEFPQKHIKLKLFDWRIEMSIFKFFLYATIISFIFLILDLKPLFGWDNVFINNSADLLVLVLTTLLTIFFFIWLDKIVLFNGKTTTLLNYVIRKCNLIPRGNEKRNYFLKTINELTYYAIIQQDEHLQKTLLEFYYSEFSIIRREHNKEEPLIYSYDLYLLVYNLNVELVNNQNRKLPAIEHRAVSGNWLLGEDFEDITISDVTYNWLWRNMYVICDHEKFIKKYWSFVHQYFDHKLEQIFEDFDFETSTKKNDAEVKKRFQERKTFLEFHYALGGLLLYRNQYKSLKYIFEYTQSIPPRYVLLPESMTEIFKWFEEFRNEFKNHSTPIDLKYYFPELDNLGNRRQVNYWICCYLAVLFIRQYSLHANYITQNFTGQPNLPDDVIELYNWLDSVSIFEKCLDDVLQNEILIQELDYLNIVVERKVEFKQFIVDLKENITRKIGEKKQRATLSPDKIEKFNESTNAIITNAFQKYDNIFVAFNEAEQDDKLKLFINGSRILITKSAFTDDDVTHLNYDTIFAKQIAENSIDRFIPNSFFVSRTKRYLLNKENILLGLDILINKNPDIIIIAVNLSYDLNLITKKYAAIIRNIPSREYRVQDVLFVLNKSDLPSIVFKDSKPEDIKNNQLVLINDKIKLYTSIIDINQVENTSIKEQWPAEDNIDNLDFKVQVCIAFLCIIYWKKERNIVQINIASEYKEEGLQNEISEIESLPS